MKSPPMRVNRWMGNDAPEVSEILMLGVGADQDFIRRLRLGARTGIRVARHLEVGAPVGAVVADRDQALGTCVVVDPARVAGEVGPAPSVIRCDARRRSLPPGGKPHELVPGPEMRREPLAARPLHRYDP